MLYEEMMKNIRLEIDLGMYGQYYNKPELFRERTELNNLYSFYEQNEDWYIDESNIKYKPSKTIYNVVKQCHNVQQRHFFDEMPTYNFMDKDGNELPENQKLWQKIIEENNFDKLLKNAFTDATVYGRTGIRVSVNNNNQIILKSYTPLEYLCTRNDMGEIVHVNFMYCDKYTAAKAKPDQRWIISNIGYNELGQVYEDFKVLDGEGNRVPSMFDRDMQLLDIPFIPFVEIENDGGVSDLEAVRGAQNDYNKYKNEYTDTVRFNLSPISVTVDASFGKRKDASGNIVSVDAVVAPNAHWDLTSSGSGTAQAFTLEKNIDTEAYKLMIDGFIDFIYNSYDVPKPDLIKDFNSGKQMDKAFEGLTKRCRNKSIDWRIGLKQLINMVLQLKELAGLYPEYNTVSDSNVDVVFHFRTFETPEERALSLLPVLEAGAISLERYLKTIGIEDVDEEIEAIINNKQVLADPYLNSLIGIAENTTTDTE